MSDNPWFRLLPEWLVSCRADWLRPDTVAGLTTGAVIIPKAMAYAMMAGLPVQVGLYTALVPMVIYAVLGTSRVLSVSTTNVGDPDRRSVGAGGAQRQPRSPAESLSDLDAAGGSRTFAGAPAAPGNRGELYLRAGARWFPSRHRAGHCGGPDPEDPWHPLHKRHIRSERPLNSSHPSKNVVSNAGRRAHDNRVSAEHGAFPAETASAVAGGSCCDSGRVLPEFATSGCRTGGPHTAGIALDGEARPFVGNRAVARRIRNCLDEFHGDGCGRPSLRAKWRGDTASRQRAACNWPRQCRR